MPKPKPIQITIPNPCQQSWDEMTPEGQGRHCAHCQKVVIDFTGWSDTALYEFITQSKGEKSCGRFRANQLNRNIVPIQPRNRFYGTFIGLGLTLLFTHTPGAHIHARAPLTEYQYSMTMPDMSDINDEVPPVGSDTIVVTGIVKNNNNVLLADAGVCLYGIKGERWIGKTDKKGAFEIRIPNIENIEALSLFIDKEGYHHRIIPLDKNEVKIPFRIILQAEEEIFMGMGG